MSILMPGFTPIPFSTLLGRMQREVELSGAIFDLPLRAWFFPDGELDFSATHFARRAGTPLGPAAGPHTQLAQNIVLAWLGGSRIIELKTVQVRDDLRIPRPCIHIPNVGYNIEWSQELSVAESLREYAKAVYLIEILKHTQAFGALAKAGGFANAGHTVYDTSVGYDLAGIRSEKVTGFLRALRNAAPHLDELRRELTGNLAVFRELALPPDISGCVTLSTFHGCPANEIEAIVRYLLEELGFHVIIKFNPTLLGFDRVRELLHDRLGYHYLELRREAFDQDLQYDEALEMLRRLRRVAESHGTTVGAKFTNTLVVANKREFFPTQTDAYMYLSGQPLHVISMNLMQQFREDLGFEIPISFSAGIDSKNFPAAVACGMVPVTTCTDLLRQGGYARLPRYLRSLGEVMSRCQVTTREAYVLAARGHADAAVEEALQSVLGGGQVWHREGARLEQIARQSPSELPHALRETATTSGLDGEAIVWHAMCIAGRLNGRDIVPALADDPRYHARNNQKEPRQIGRALQLYDCINCDLCIAACPNDAIFAYEATPRQAPTEHLRVRGDTFERMPGAGFALREAHQLAVVVGLCNLCSNCEVYCPETGAPFQLKEQVFSSLAELESAPGHDGFCRQGNTLHARLEGWEMLLTPEPERNRAILQGKGFQLALRWEPFEVLEARTTLADEVSLDTALLWRMRTAWESIFHSNRPNMVNPDPSAIPTGVPAASRSRK